MLKISGDGRRAALDLRLLGLPQATPGKIAAAADRIAAIWAAHHDDEYFDPGGVPYPVRGSLQLVFCDLGTPRSGLERLRRAPRPAHRPRRAAGDDPVHPRSQDRPGQGPAVRRLPRPAPVAVLVGSTEKMGVGTNVQDRAIALHHLDAPWRPADVAQREGRILRQGNLNRNLGREVEIIRYVTERSFDGYMWQTLERKARFIGQVMHGRLDTREITDIGDTALSFSEVKAIATGNPLLMDKAEADAALARLQRAERAHLRNQDALRHAITDYEAEISRLTVLADAVDTAIARRQDTRGEKFAMTVDGMHHTKRADAGQHVKDILEREASGLAGQLRRAVSIGQLGGFAVNAEVYRSLGATKVTIDLEGAPGTTIDLPASGLRGADPVGLVTRLEHRLAELETRKAKALADIEHARRQIDPRPQQHRPALPARRRNSPPPATESATSMKLSTAWRSRTRAVPGRRAAGDRRRPAAVSEARTQRSRQNRAPSTRRTRRMTAHPARREHDSPAPAAGRDDSRACRPTARPSPPTRRTGRETWTRPGSWSTRPPPWTPPVPGCGSSTGSRSPPGG